jgi:uncharacterized SAM-binding protein YcdF (DUF218 family)
MAVAAVVIVVVAALTARLFVWPTTDPPAKVGAIFVLGGNGPRLAEAMTLASKRYAPEVVLSVSPGDRPPFCGSTYRGTDVVCFSPHPASTQGEARFIGSFARRHHLQRIIVVSGRAQTTRARIRVERCYGGTVLMVPAAAPSPFSAAAGDVVYEWGALLKAELWQRSC